MNDPRTRLELLDALPKHSIGAELGVFEGVFSREILARVQPEVLFLVDTFEGRIASGDHNGEHVHFREGRELHELLRIEHAASPGVHVVRAEARQWLAQLKPGLLDWVYLDTAHEYQQTLAELAAAARAVKPGGLIGGHDYSPRFPGVVRAVDEFCEANFMRGELFAGDRLPSFLLRAPVIARDAAGNPAAYIYHGY